MPTIGPMELGIVLVIALVIFGPKKVPELGRSIGSGFKEFKQSVSGEKPQPAEVEAEVEAEART